MTVRQSIDVERLVTWALDQGAGRGIAESNWLGGGRSPEAIIIERARLGTSIDGGGHAGDGSEAPDDALEVWAAIKDLPHGMRGLVLDFGRLGIRPDPWVDARPSLGPVLDDKDRPALSKGWGPTRKPLPRYCPIQWETTAAEINLRRDTYSRWHAGLDFLARLLSDRPLSRWIVTGPSAPARPADPWLFADVVPLHTIPDSAYPDHVVRRPVHPLNLALVDGGRDRPSYI